MAPIKERTSHLNYFTELCRCLAIYDMVYPLGDALKAYTQKASGEWVPHAMLGVTSLFTGSPDESLDEFNTAMSLVPVEDVGDVFGVIVKFSKLSPYFRAQLPSVAPEWRGKLSQAEHSNALLRELDKLLDNPAEAKASH